MNYRIQYIIKGTREKVQEIADCYGTYRSYQLDQESEHGDTEFIEMELPDMPETEYKANFNRYNSSMRKCAAEDKNHSILPVSCAAQDKNPFKTGVWVEREVPMYDYDTGAVKPSLVGTELANFLNFDIDLFMKGGYTRSWKYDSFEDRTIIAGWDKQKGFDLSNLSDRQALAVESVFGSDSEEIHKNIPFFIRMFGCKFINMDEWQYDMEEVEQIKDLQKRLKVFCEKVFFPKDENDKRDNLKRYCDEVKQASRREILKLIPKGWYTPPSLEQALAVECYATIIGNVTFFKCENCGLHTVSDDKRSRLCNRLHYDGNQYDSLEYKCVEYYYTCRQETYIKRNKTYDTVIERITESERSRLYKVIEGSGMLKEISYKLLDKLKETVDDNEQKYIKKMKDALNNKEDEQIRLQIANEYLDILIREVDKAIKENIGSQTGLTFKRRNNPKITSLEGNLFG